MKSINSEIARLKQEIELIEQIDIEKDWFIDKNKGFANCKICKLFPVNFKSDLVLPKTLMYHILDKHYDKKQIDIDKLRELQAELKAYENCKKMILEKVKSYSFNDGQKIMKGLIGDEHE